MGGVNASGICCLNCPICAAGDLRWQTVGPYDYLYCTACGDFDPDYDDITELS